MRGKPIVGTENKVSLNLTKTNEKNDRNAMFENSMKKVNISKEYAIILILIFFMVAGLATRLYISIHLPFDSDSVGMGLMSMEIGKYHNYLLTGYHVPSADSLIFTELIPFQLVPQILTNYNPLTLKLVVFVIFLLSILVFGYLIYFITRNKISALLFGALAANFAPEGYFWLAYPTTHNATILFGAFILLLFLYLNRSMRTMQEKNGIAQADDEGNLGVPWLYVSLLGVLIFLAVFSDTLIVVWVLAPVILAYLLFYKKKTRMMNFVLLSVIIISAVAFGIRTYLIPGWIMADYGMRGISDIFFVNIPLFFRAQMMFLSSGLAQLMNKSAITTVFTILSAALMVIVLVYAIRNIIYDVKKSTQEKRFLYAIFLISLTLIFVSFLVSDYVYDLMGARYLTFSAFSILVLIAISYPEKEPLFLVIIFAVLAVSVISGFLYIDTLNPNPNEREYNLISYLSTNNLTYGYGTYWDSNVITYLSGEKVIIRSTYFLPDRIRPHMLNSCDRWWEYKPAKAFLISDTTRLTDPSQYYVPSLKQRMNLSSALHCEQYDIYVLNMAYSE
jgi:hypothetical protein